MQQKATIYINHEDASLRTFILFMQTADAVQKYSDTHLYRALGISTIKFIVLNILNHNGGQMAPSDIARWTLREKHNITTLIERMSRDGLVRTERSNRDKRFINVILTRKGKQLRNKATTIAKEIVDKVMSSFNQDEIPHCERMLMSMRQNAHDGLDTIARQ